MTTPLVSIVLPTYNRAHVLHRSVRSVLAQSFTDWELIIIDDGSTDDTERLCRDYAARLGPKFRYIQQENQGVSAARNRGMQEAAGEWIAFLDSDDLFLPSKLSLQMGMLASNPKAGFCFTNYLFFDDDLKVTCAGFDIPREFQGEVYPKILETSYNYVMTPSVVVARDRALAAGGFSLEMKVCEDIDFWGRICQKTTACVVREPSIGVHVRSPDVFPYSAGMRGRQQLYDRARARDDGIEALTRNSMLQMYSIFGGTARDRGEKNIQAIFDRDVARVRTARDWSPIVTQTINQLRALNV